MLNKIRSNFILSKIFKHIKNRTKINIIKYNRKIQNKLFIKKEDFDIYISLKKLNETFNCNIRDIDIEELDLNKKIKKAKELKYLEEIEFKELKKLNLKDNNIFGINFLSKVKFEKIRNIRFK